MMRVRPEVERFLTDAAVVLGLTLPADAVEPANVFILGLKRSPFDDALACSLAGRRARR